jgi:hypothetical protein
MSDEPPRMYTAEEAAGLLKGCTANWLKVNAAKGLIPSTKFGRKRVWTAAQLGEIVLARQQKPGANRPPRTPAARSGGRPDVSLLQARIPKRRRIA